MSVVSMITVRCDWCDRTIKFSGDHLARVYAKKKGLDLEVSPPWFETQAGVSIVEILAPRLLASPGHWRLGALVYPGVKQNVDMLGDFCSENCHRMQVASMRRSMMIKEVRDEKTETIEIVVEPPKAYSKVVAKVEFDNGGIGYVRSDVLGVSEQDKREFQEEFDETMSDGLETPMSDGKGNHVSGNPLNWSPEQLARMAATREWHRKFNEKLPKPVEVHKEGKTDFYTAEDRYNEVLDGVNPSSPGEITQTVVGEAMALADQSDAIIKLSKIPHGDEIPAEIQFELNKTHFGRWTLEEHRGGKRRRVVMNPGEKSREQEIAAGQQNFPILSGRPWWKRMFGA